MRRAQARCRPPEKAVTGITSCFGRRGDWRGAEARVAQRGACCLWLRPVYAGTNDKCAITSWEETMPAAVERSTMRKVYWRLLPISILTYFLCYLDRINVGFAALTMNKDLGLDAAIYGMAAGGLFWGYFPLLVPSNFILDKIGARSWIARIMVSWGLLSGATPFCVGPCSFLTIP